MVDYPTGRAYAQKLKVRRTRHMTFPAIVTQSSDNTEAGVSLHKRSSEERMSARCTNFALAKASLEEFNALRTLPSWRLCVLARTVPTHYQGGVSHV